VPPPPEKPEEDEELRGMEAESAPAAVATDEATLRPKLSLDHAPPRRQEG
jgi:hypothetical protein